jgi:hypothetical protein
MAETSATLLKRLNNRSDSVAWQRLVDLYSPLINAWLRRQGVSAEDADDLSQEVLGIVVREVAQFRHNGRRGLPHLAANDYYQLPSPVPTIAAISSSDDQSAGP